MIQLLLIVASIVMSVAAIPLWMGRQRMRLLLRSRRSDLTEFASYPLSAALAFSLSATSAIGLTVDMSWPRWHLILTIPFGIVMGLITIPHARYIVIDRVMTETWWVSTWHRRVGAGLWFSYGVASAIAGIWYLAIPALICALIWWFGYWHGGGGWGNVPVGDPDPAGSKSR